jgi:DNA-binding transcriptional ArsR family regulator
MEETREYHARYLMAVNNPVRRRILRALKQGHATIEALHSDTGLAPEVLEWHLSILEYGLCVEKNVRDGKAVYKLTKEGMIVDYLDK